MSTEQLDEAIQPFSSDDEDNMSENSDYEDTLEGNNCSLLFNEAIYVITVNEKPKCFTKTEEDAKKMMWEVARKLYVTHPSYKTFLVKTGPNTMEVEERYKWFVMSHRQTAYYLKYHKIPRIIPNENENEK